MSAQRRPQGERSWLAPPLAALTALVVSAPRTVILLSLLLAAVSAIAGASLLGFRSSRLDLLNPNSAYNRRWLAYLDEFGDQDDLVIVVEGRGVDEITPVIDEIAAELRADPGRFQAVLCQRDLSLIHEKALYYLEVEHLQHIERLLDQLGPVLEGHWSELSAARVLSHAAPSQLADRGSGPVQQATAVQAAGPAALWHEPYLGGLSMALADSPAYQSPWWWVTRLVGRLDEQFASHYLLADQGRLGFLLLRMPRGEDHAALSELLGEVRRIVREVDDRHAEVAIGLTGMPILEDDEMQASQNDTVWASLLSLCGVACVFVAGFGGLRRPLLTVAVLLIAIAWTFGYITVAVGHLNILSLSFGIILIGLGIDFGIHYIAQYGQELESGAAREAALQQTARNVGPGIVTGGLTTAIAFCTAVLTDFTGVAELGVIAAGGIILCVIAAIAVLPAIISIYDRPGVATPGNQPLPIAALLGGFARFPRLVAVAALLLTIVSGLGIARLRYDHNLLNLQPARLESVELERKLAARMNRGIWFALSVSRDREELLEKKRRFDTLGEVAATEEISSLLPAASTEKQRIVARIRRRLATLPGDPPLIPVGRQEEVLGLLSRLGAAAPPVGSALAQQISALPAAEYFRRVSRFQQQSAEELRELLASIRGMAGPAPPAADDLPAPLVERFLGRNGRHLLRVYGRGDIWDTASLERFVAAVEQIDPWITGHPIQTYYASRQMQRSYLHAAVYSLLAVSIVLMIDFRRIRYWLLAMVPMGLGMFHMFGLLGWLDIPLNPANMIVLPLILGIGIDDGVHVIHDYLRKGLARSAAATGSSSRRWYRPSNATATAVVITSATTMIGFGSMMMASHRGLRSLGQVLTLGVFCCLVSSLVLLPPLLNWLGDAFSAERVDDKLKDSTGQLTAEQE